ncbi:hypothetical protein GCM10027275_51280 [Rhabdobacter roseus]|uniref:Uncharacterized protein n=1 Tax=Rhabdobacter roseus TaxID=1655419 RepID=A0A840TZY2_9BACT|nr:hypothetical protein [Rhabdobacter roseus]MBB5287202.1 hypothetical protein [Rhabdobacter roseus]
MALNFQPSELNIFNLVETGDIPASSEVSGIELRLTDVFVMDNNTHAPLSKKKDKGADLYVIVIAINDLGNVVQTLDLKGFPKTLDNTGLGINRTIHFWQKTETTPKAPSQIHTFISVIKSKQKTREAGEILSNAKNDTEFSNIITSIKDIAKNATPVGQVADLVTSLAQVIGKFLGKVEDQPLFTWFQSFTNLGGDFDDLGITPVTLKNNFVSVTINKIIRDANQNGA